MLRITCERGDGLRVSQPGYGKDEHNATEQSFG
jgi:hypothetical protein